jgi:hypothetical protein
MSSVQTFSNPLRKYFTRSWMLLEKPLSLPTKVSPWFTSVFSKSVHQFRKPVQPDLLSPSDLPVNSVRKSRVRSFSKTGQPDLSSAQPNLGPVESPAESLSERRTPWWKPVQPVLSPLFPTAANFWGILYIPPHTLSLHSLLPSPRFFGWPTSKQGHSIHLSHPNSHRLQSFEGPLVWGEVDLTRCWVHLDSLWKGNRVKPFPIWILVVELPNTNNWTN